jgi:branched-chain amino acid transport system substrate-binding protein
VTLGDGTIHAKRGENGMRDDRQELIDRESPEDLLEGKAVSRRGFLKIAGVAGVAVGAGAGLGGLIAACGAEETTTTTAGPTTTAAPATTTTAAPMTTTTAAAGAEVGREIKVGVISPLTGAIAVFAVADRWGIDMVKEFVGDEVVLGDGKLHKVSWLLRDTQSDDSRASQVTSDLILNDKADILSVGGSPTTAVPAAVMAETNGTPLLSSNCPWQAMVFGRYPDLKNPAECPDKWVFGSLFGIEQGTSALVQVLNKIPTNKVAGLFLGNTIDTQAWQTPGIGMEDSLKAAGYTVVNPGYFNLGTEDFSAMISEYKKAGCEINVGSNPGKDFPNFWTQCAQQGYNPKACNEMIGLGAYEDQLAMGDSAFGIIQIFTWHKSWPYKDSITGMTNAQVADKYEKDLGKPWDQFITGYMRNGWVLDVLKRTKDLDSKDSIREAVAATKLELITGPMDLTIPVDPAGLRVTPNIWKQPISLGQLQKGTTWPVEGPMVAAVDAPGVTDADLTQPFTIKWGA